jgi:hypothetical protein
MDDSLRAVGERWLVLLDLAQQGGPNNGAPLAEHVEALGCEEAKRLLVASVFAYTSATNGWGD